MAKGFFSVQTDWKLYFEGPFGMTHSLFGFNINYEALWL